MRPMVHQRRRCSSSTSMRRFILAASLMCCCCCCCHGRVLTRKVMNMAVLAAEVSSTVYNAANARRYAAQFSIDGTSNSEGFFISEPDAAIAVRVDDVCIMAFRGTSEEYFRPTWLADVQTNLKQDQVELLGSCTIAEGIYVAYNAAFRSDLEDSVRSCMTSCPDCKLLITGHSQGGAIANAAGVVFEAYGYSPYVITFGQPPVLGNNCPVNGHRWFRFIHAVPGRFLLHYDPVPMVDFGSGLFYGHEIVISSDDSTGVDHVGKNRHVDKLPWNIVAHFSNVYLATMTAIKSNGYPIDASGFRSGAQCTMNMECRSGSCGWRWWKAAYECA